MSIECLKPAHDKIVKSELDKMILEKGHLIGYEILLNRSIYFENCEEFFKKEQELFLNSDRKISSQSESAKKILELENAFQKEGNYVGPDSFKELLLKYPNFLGKIVLGDEIYNYEKYGFPSQKSLEESITSFCIGEREFFSGSRTEDYWRTGNIKNRISLNVHGDLYASQCDVSGKTRIEKTLFGENLEVFETYKNIETSTGISAHQDWSQFLVSLLKYSEYLGKRDLNEIVNWKTVLENSGGGRGTATSEAMFGTNFDEFQLEMLMETPVLNDKIEKLERFPLSIYSGQESSVLPYVFENKLFYLGKDNSGNISLENFSHIYKNKKFSKSLEYCEEDLPYVLTATYKYFARDRSKMTKILDYFNSNDNFIPTQL